MDKDLLEGINKAVQAGASQQAAQQRAFQIQQTRNQTSVSGGNFSAPNLVANNGAISSIVNSIARPFVQTGQNIGGGAFEIARMLADKLGDKRAYGVNAQGQQMQNPFISNQSLQKADTNKLGFIADQARNSAAVASYALPVGGSAKIFGKTIAPGALKGGALVGAAQELSNPNADAGSVVKSAITGGVLGKGTEIVGKALGGFKKGASALEEVGNTTRAGHVKLKASISGAADEKAAQAVLKKYNILGRPQQRYEKLQPVMDSLGQEIEAVLGRNAKKVSERSLQDLFAKKVVPFVRQGDVTLDEALLGFKEYIANIKKVSPDALKTTQGLFSLKKDLQSGMQSLYSKVSNGASLTPTQKVSKAIRDTLDEVVSTLNPEVKALTRDQSKLFDAVKSIASARNTVPTVRALGIQIPKGPYNATVDTLGKTAQTVGKIGQKVPNIPTSSLTGNIASRIPSFLGSANNSFQTPSNSETPVLGQQSSFGTSPQNQGGLQITPEVVQAAYFTLPKEKADMIKGLYELQQKATEEKPKTEAQQAREDSAYLVERAISQLQEGNLQLGPIAGPLEELKSKVNAGDPSTLAFNRTVAALKGAIAKARAGTSFTPNEEKLLDQYTPSVGDSYQQVVTKLQALQEFFGR